MGSSSPVDAERDADRRADAHPDRTELHRRADGVDHLAPERRRLGRVGHVLGQDHELVAAEPGDEVALPGRVLHALGDRAQHLVAHRVAVGVVRTLEVVEVDEQQCQADARPPRAAQGRLERVGRGDAVVQPGQPVVGGLVDEVLLQHVALEDRPREDLQRLLERGTEPAGQRLGQHGGVELEGGQRLRLGLEQPQVGDEVVERLERDDHVARTATRQRFHVEVALADGSRVVGQQLERP